MAVTNESMVADNKAAALEIASAVMKQNIEFNKVAEPAKANKSNSGKTA